MNGSAARPHAGTLAPAVIVHGLAMARAALTPGLPVTLLSARGAGAFAGVGWWQAMVAAARHAAASDISAPNLCQDILDCADAPGRALEALRAGQKLIVLTTTPGIWLDIAGRAEALGATVLASAPAALDLAVHGAERRLAAWLRGEHL